MNTTAQVKRAIKKSTRTITNEPLEILKTVRDQVITSENLFSVNQENDISQNDSGIKDEEQYKKQIAERDSRHLEALETELKDIRRQKLFNEITQKVQSGVDVPIEEFSELSHEQKEVLKAQVEVIKKQKSETLNQDTDLVEPASKKGRRFGSFGQKQAAERQQTRVEKPVQSST